MKMEKNNVIENDGGYDTIVYIQNDSPYRLTRPNPTENVWTGGTVVQYPEFVIPYTSGLARVNGDASSGSYFWIKYSVNLEDKEIGYVEFEAKDGKGGSNWEHNTCKASRFQIYNNSVVTFEKEEFSLDVDRIPTLFRMTAETSTGSSSWKPTPNDQRIKGEGCIIEYTRSECTDINVDLLCDVNQGGHPVTVNYTISWSSLRSYELSVAPLDYSSEWEEMSNVLFNCIFSDEKTTPAFIDYPDKNYNAFSWLLGRTNQWIDCPENYQSLKNMVKGKFDIVDCSDPAAEAAVYRQPSDYDGPYVHAAKTYGFISGFSKWTSKFGSGPLMTQSSMDGIINPYNMKVSYYTCDIHYGIPAVCLRRIDHVTDSYDERDLFFFSESEKSVLNEAISKIDAALVSNFSTLYQKWNIFLSEPSLQLNSCLRSFTHHKSFDDIIDLGSDVTPLVVEKLLLKSEFKSVLIYERIQEIEERQDNLMSIQDLAAYYAHQWVEEYSPHDIDIVL